MKTRIFSIILLFTQILVGYHTPTSPIPKKKPEAISPPSAGQLCTSLCLDNGDHCVFGTNMDHSEVKVSQVFVNKRNVLKTGWESGTTGERLRWISKYGSVTINMAGYQLVWGGMNEAGLMISTMSLSETLEPKPDERPPLPSALWVQYLLDNYSKIEEVIASETLVRVENARDHYLICDRTGACAVIELLDGRMVAYRGATLPVKALTNSTYQESLKALGDGDYWKLEVFGVNPDSPASQVGLLEGDRILAADGVKLEGEQLIKIFYAIIAAHDPGDELRLTILHPGEKDPTTLEVKLVPLPEDVSHYVIPPDVPVQILSLGFYPRFTGDFLARFTTAAEWVETFRATSSQEAVAYAFDALDAVSREDTVYSAVFDPANMRIYFRSYLNQKIRYLDLSKINFSCGAPAMMLDIHTAGEGDLSTSLVAYSHETALNYMVSVLPRWTDIPPLMIETILTGFENNVCLEDNAMAVNNPNTYLKEHPALLPPVMIWIALTAVNHLGLVWLLLTLLSLIHMLWRLSHHPGTPWRTWLPWILTVILLGPFGMLASIVIIRKRILLGQSRA
jgi:penicillin V acylase-like amidase (Ntn superfamily)